MKSTAHFSFSVYSVQDPRQGRHHHSEVFQTQHIYEKAPLAFEVACGGLKENDP